MNIEQFFEKNRKVALAFSGGVDSAFLLYAGMKCGADIKAYYVNTEFQPEFELEDAKRLASELDANMEIISLSALVDEKVRENGPRRCYYCKQRIFSAILEAAKRDGYEIILDGTNASDDVNDRPGMKALEELCVKSPLRECGLSKDMIRELSKEAGLFTWNKPAYACLATRIPTGTSISTEDLEITEKAEGIMAELGFVDFRVRMDGGANGQAGQGDIGDRNGQGCASGQKRKARLEIRECDMALLLEKRKEILEKLGDFYSAVTLNLKFR